MGLIRFILACAVVLCHTSLILGYSPLSGDLAVQVFYIISGFYMALILNEKYVGKGANLLFYTNRALKIYPIYWINLILLILWSILVFKLGYPSTLSFYSIASSLPILTAVYFIFINILIIGLDSIFFFGIKKNGSLFFTPDFNKTDPHVYSFAFNTIAWTVGIELLFYLIAPFIVKKKVIYPVTILLLSLVLRLLLAHFGYVNSPWNYMFFPNQLMFFMAGVLSYNLYKKINAINFNKTMLMVMHLTFLFIILLYYQFFTESYIKQIILFLAVTTLIPASFLISKKSKFDRIMGNLSYPIYISQSLINKIVVIKKFPKIISVGFTALIVVIAFSIILDLLVTNPIEKYRQNRIKKSSI
ncbi:acyltransferase family protein [Mucilaginibacter sp. X5P1]|uniref:acyltransferase family protein n=1 Tax=Mucilaginibacter sp. X5P1 TaxID=2723088 RepID=UPI0016130E0D|nr:acyltransferase family protein [Mucilaginibacter sp. X5P1]MBB6141958.1 peptidoglycan/LPS O-acetylase OafA/YrhL [Mucilaginibacter sp. X5P1]